MNELAKGWQGEGDTGRNTLHKLQDIYKQVGTMDTES